MPELKNLITNYQASQCEESFETIFEMISDKLLSYARKQAAQHRLRWEDVESETYFVLLKAVQSYNISIGVFEKYLYQMLHRQIIDMQRKEISFNKYTDRYLEDAATSTGNEPELAAIKKEQRELLRSFTENADDKSRQALAAYASSKTFREAGKLIGVEHKTVQNRIRKISATNPHVSLNDYITA